MTPAGDNAVAAFYEAARARPDAPALAWRVDGRRATRTYGELSAAVTRLATALVREHLLPSEPAIVIAPRGPQRVTAHLAVPAAGGVCVPVSDACRDEELIEAVRDTQARVVLVAGPHGHATVGRLRARMPSVHLVVSLDGRRGGNGPDVVPLSRLLRLPSDVATVAEVRRRRTSWSGDDIAAVHMVTPSPGRRLGAVVSHAGTMYPIAAITGLVDLGDPPTLVLSGPIDEPEAVWAVGAVLARGGCVWLTDPDGDDLLDTLREAQPTMLVAPTGLVAAAAGRAVAAAGGHEAAVRAVRLWERCAEGAHLRRPVLAARLVAARARVLRPASEALGGPRRLTLLTGRGTPDPGLVALLQALDQRPATAWSMLETCGPVAVNPPDAHRPGSVGRPLPGTRVRADDDGVLHVHGPGVMRGYFGHPHDTREVIVDGWLRTGVRGRVENGYVYLDPPTPQGAAAPRPPA